MKTVAIWLVFCFTGSGPPQSSAITVEQDGGNLIRSTSSTCASGERSHLLIALKYYVWTKPEPIVLDRTAGAATGTWQRRDLPRKGDWLLVDQSFTARYVNNRTPWPIGRSALRQMESHLERMNQFTGACLCLDSGEVFRATGWSQAQMIAGS